MSALFLDAATPAVEVVTATRCAMNGTGPVLALGAPVADDAVLPAGTIAVATTSGSSGVPKSVILSRSALTASAMATADRLGAGEWMLTLPPTYVAGLQVIIRSLVQGHDPVILDGHFSPDAFLDTAGRMHAQSDGAPVPRFVSLVPAQLQTLLDAADDPAVAGTGRSFRAMLVGGQAVAPALLERAREESWRIVRTYGSTETSGGCVYDGRALERVSLRIVDGELQVAGPTLADGYLGEPERTDAVFLTDPDGVRWYRTGDAGALSDDGILSITGRLDNVIISGGVNVSLDRVERVVRAVAGFEDAVVVGADHERWGQVPVVVTARSDNAESLARVRDAAEAAVGVAGRPDRIVVVAEIPLLSSGKPDRRALTRLVTE